MGKHGKTIHVRLTPEQEAKFMSVHAHYRGLASSMLLKFLLSNQLNKSDEELDLIIQAQIRGEQGPTTKPQNRISDANASRKRH